MNPRFLSLLLAGALGALIVSGAAQTPGQDARRRASAAERWFQDIRMHKEL
jgi:hypothetical protein